MQWLPIATDGRRPAWFFVVDADGPRRFAVQEWTIAPRSQVDFTVALDEEGTVRTPCTVVAEPSDDGLRLRFRHGGWHTTGFADLRVRQLRGRFADAWRESLRMAGEVTGTRQA